MACGMSSTSFKGLIANRLYNIVFFLKYALITAKGDVALLFFK